MLVGAYSVLMGVFTWPLISRLANASGWRFQGLVAAFLEPLVVSSGSIHERVSL